MTQIAFAAGFESLRRFNQTFKDRYRLAPTALRRRPPQNQNTDAYRFELAVRPPFDFPGLLNYWRARATPGVEYVDDQGYQRTVAVGKHVGWISIEPDKHPHTIRVQISSELSSSLTAILARLKHMLDTRVDPVEVGRQLAGDSLLRQALKRFPDLRIPGAFDGFECAVRTVLGQQVSVRAATTIAGRLASRFGRSISTPRDCLTTVFPTPEALADATLTELMSLGITTRRAETIRAVARVFADRQIRIEPGTDPDRVRTTLLALPGIGEWTVEYLLLRAAGWPDAFPSGDLGLQKAAGLSAAKLQERAELWRPWRGHAAIVLWRSLSQSN